ncbi:hypothetical protein EV363DRAFT_1334470, partial [Boletus edulis]
MAAYLYESYIEPNTVPGNNSFVAGFVQCKSQLPRSSWCHQGYSRPRGQVAQGLL